MHLRLYHLTLLVVVAATVDYRFFADVPGLPSITLLEIAALVAVILSTALLRGRPGIRQRAYRVVRSNQMVFGYLGWITLAALVNLAWSSVPAATLKDLLAGFILFLLVAVSVRGANEARGVLAIYLLGAMVQVVLASAQVMFGGPRPVPVAEVAAYKQDVLGGGVLDVETVVTGLFMHPNGLALFILPAALLILAQVSYGHVSLPKRLGLVFMLALSLFALWHTQAKGAFAWLVIGVMVLSLPNAMAPWRAPAGWTGLLGGIVVIILASMWLYQEMGQLGTVVSRIQLIAAALAVLEDNMLVLTIGGGSDHMYAYSNVFSNMEYASSHNTYLDQALLFGLPGLLFYLGILLSALRRVAAAPQQPFDGRWQMIRRFLHAALIALLGAFFFEPGLFGSHLQAIFFLFTGLIAAMEINRNMVCFRNAL